MGAGRLRRQRPSPARRGGEKTLSGKPPGGPPGALRDRVPLLRGEELLPRQVGDGNPDRPPLQRRLPRLHLPPDRRSVRGEPRTDRFRPDGGGDPRHRPSPFGVRRKGRRQLRPGVRGRAPPPGRPDRARLPPHPRAHGQGNPPPEHEREPPGVDGPPRRGRPRQPPDQHQQLPSGLAPGLLPAELHFPGGRGRRAGGRGRRALHPGQLPGVPRGERPGGRGRGPPRLLPADRPPRAPDEEPLHRPGPLPGNPRGCGGKGRGDGNRRPDGAPPRGASRGGAPLLQPAPGGVAPRPPVDGPRFPRPPAPQGEGGA